jgi:Sulfotransferase domain
VHYQELTRDPIGTVQRIYTFFGRSLSQEAEACMQRYLAQHSQHRYGEHRYTLAQFGLDPAEETRRYSAYRDYFGIPSEGHTPAG